MNDKKKLKPLDLNPENRDLVITPSTDQAALSNQIKSTPPVQTPTPNYSKAEYIAFIDGMIKTISQSKDPLTLSLVPVLEFAQEEIGKCTVCKGKGQSITWDKPQHNYNAKTSPKGQKYFLVSCNTCSGSGKQLHVQCASCGKDAAIMPKQMHFLYCVECETRLIKSGVLL